jgi:hypothetical protein
MFNVKRRVWLWVLPVMLYAGPAAAQDERLRVSFGTATTAGGGDASLALTASAGYRFRERLLFEVDLTATESPVSQGFERRFALDEPGGGLVRVGRGAPGPGVRSFIGGPTDPFRGPLFDRTIGFADTRRPRPDGDLYLATMGLRYELGTERSRLQPYVAGGLGLARTDTELTSARTGLAAAAGIGTSLRVYRALSLDVDARYLLLDRGPNLTRLGGGVSYRF